VSEYWLYYLLLSAVLLLPWKRGELCSHAAPLVCIHHQDIWWKLRAPEFQGCYGHDHIFLGFFLYCCCHLLLLHLHQAHFNPQIRFLHQTDSPKFSPVQHLLYLSKVPYFPVDNARVIYTKTFSKRKKMTVHVIQWMRVMQLKSKKFQIIYIPMYTII
jgi:hypothetical protein